jgi:hypothetical protein
MAKTKEQVRHVQSEMNAFVVKNPSLGLAKVVVDGDHGKLSKKLMHEIKYLLGYSHKKAKISSWSNIFLHRMRHPTLVEPRWYQTKLAVKNGKKRRATRRRKLRRVKISAFLKPGVGTFDGKPVAKTAIPVLRWCREHGWKGWLVSGYRTPAYSEHLCIVMCGRPSCPGRCAGRATNHAYAQPDRFGLDVSDYVNFRRIVANCPIKPHIHNELPNDLVHFSPSGR